MAKGPAGYPEDPGLRRDRVAAQLESLETKLAHALAVLPDMLADARQLRALVAGAGTKEEDDGDGDEEAGDDG